jgi:hypothetical protein
MDIKQMAMQINAARKTSRRSHCSVRQAYTRCIVQPYLRSDRGSGAACAGFEKSFRQWIGQAADTPALLDGSPRKCVTRRLRFAIPKWASFILLAD